MKNKKTFITLALALVLPSAVCAFSQETDGIKIQVKDVMKNPYAQVIDHAGWTFTTEDLQKKDIAALTVTITNNTDNPVCISGRSVKMNQIAPEAIAAKFKKREIVRPFLLSCVSFVVGAGSWCKMLVQESLDGVEKVHTLNKKWKMVETEGDFLQDDRYDDLLEKYGIDRDNLNPLDPMFASREFIDDFVETAGDEYKQEVQDVLGNIGSNVISRSGRIMGFFALTGFGSAFAYWYYLRDSNNQLVTIFKQAALDDLVTIAPGQTVEKVIFCEGRTQSYFNFSVFNKSYVPVVDFDVDLHA